MADTRFAARLALAALTLCHTGVALAQSQPVGLTAAYRAALAHDPDWRGAEAEAEATRENDALARSLFRPKVGLDTQAGYGRVTAAVTLPPPVAAIDRIRLSGATVSGMAVVQQPLIGGHASAQARELRAAARAGEAQRDGARLQLMMRVADAYFAVLSARQDGAALAAQEASARREQRAAQARFDAGRARITDVREAQARADQAAALGVQARAALETSLFRFSELTGLGPEAVVALRDDLTARPPSGSLAQWQERAEAASPAVAGRVHLADAADARVGEFGWGSQVKVDAVGAAGMVQPIAQNGMARIDSVTGYMAGVRLQMPLYSGGGLEARRRQAAAQARAAREQVQAARRDTRMTVQNAWSGQTRSVAAIAALEAARASARLQEKAAITGRDVGIRTQSDVLMAQAQTIDAERKLAEARIGYERSRIALLAAAASLDETRLEEIDWDLGI